nr:hypothetical protein [Tanacetum cinerariifolium]
MTFRFPWFGLRQWTNSVTNPTDVLTLVSGSVDREGLIKEAFSGTNGEDAIEHIENFLKIIDPLDLPNVSYERLRLAIFPISLTRDAKEWLMNEPQISVTTWVGDKTYEEYENKWSSKLNNDPEEPWSENKVPYELIDHICEPFCFKNGKTKCPTCSSNDDGFCNGRELSRIVRVGYMTYFQDYLWYDDLADGKLKEEALKQKAIYERNHICETYANANINANYNPYLDVSRTFHNYAGRNDDETIKKEWKLNDDHGNGNFDNDLVRDSEPYHANKEEEQYKEDRCEMLENPYQEPLVCKIRRFEVITYSFRPTKKYIAIKKYEHDDLTRTNKDTCHAYQEIFRCMDEGNVMDEAHASRYSVHSGADKTYYDLGDMYWWP